MILFKKKAEKVAGFTENSQKIRYFCTKSTVPMQIYSTTVHVFVC